MTDRALSPVWGITIMAFIMLLFAGGLAYIGASIGTQSEYNTTAYGENVTAKHVDEHIAPPQIQFGLSGRCGNADHVTIDGEIHRVKNKTAGPASLHPGRYQLTIYDGEEKLGTETVVVYSD